MFLLAVYPKPHSTTMVTAWPYIYIYVTEQEAIKYFSELLHLFGFYRLLTDSRHWREVWEAGTYVTRVDAAL